VVAAATTRLRGTLTDESMENVPMLAEISDKMLPVYGYLILGAIPAVFALLFGLVRWWLAPIPLIFSGYLTYMVIDEVFEPEFGRMIIEEMGWSYVIGRVLALIGPALAALAALYLLRRRRRGVPGPSQAEGIRGA
jgi:hypothetical protein